MVNLVTPDPDEVNRRLRALEEEESDQNVAHALHDLNHPQDSTPPNIAQDAALAAAMAGAPIEVATRVLKEVERATDPRTYQHTNGTEPAQPEPFYGGVNGHNGYGNGHGNGTLRGFNVTRMSEIQMRPIEWLWEGKIPIGKVSGISGDPGLGKSQLTASMAAIVSVGGQWPVTRDRAPKGNVILLNAEDDAEDTIGPRLEAAGADLSRVFVLNAIRIETETGEGERSFDLSKDIINLRDLMAQIGDVRLVIIDPVSAYMGKVDSHNNAEVRGVLSPLKDAAAKHGTAIVLVTHLNKSQTSSALHRTQGSVAFTGAPRAVWGVVKDKENPQRRLFVPLKNNLGPDTEGLAYTVEGLRLEASDPPIHTSRILWENEAITQSADELMRDSQAEGHSAIKDAEEFLIDLLKNGWVKTFEIQAAARKAGVSWASVRRAKDELKIKAKKNAFGDGWGWELPEFRP